MSHRRKCRDATGWVVVFGKWIWNMCDKCDGTVEREEVGLLQLLRILRGGGFGSRGSLEMKCSTCSTAIRV